MSSCHALYHRCIAFLLHEIGATVSIYQHKAYYRDVSDDLNDKRI
jgi:hypothetical protein